MTSLIRELYIPRIELDFVGVEVDTARQAVALLPAALERALAADSPANAGALPGSAQALADTAAARVVAQVAEQTRQREGKA